MAKRKAAEQGARLRIGTRMTDYLRATWYEMKKVTWPTRQEAANLTLIVMVAMLALALVLGVVDWLFSQIFSLILSL
ncbi:MAG: preprotein translocase subunit SecE [Thermoleophilia bacterium]|nr:preprotein translocase subunit SecE [Thermoleophilia bacterium]